MFCRSLVIQDACTNLYAQTSSKLPKEVQGLMGEANICYARGDHDSALQMCMEIIRTGTYASPQRDFRE